MKIKARHFSWLLFISIALASAQPAVGQEEATGGEAYTVKKGDTLWDISASKLENPFSWSKIWKQNPDIKDPDLIYPGEKIALPPGAVLKKTDESAGSSGTSTAMEAPAPARRPDAGPFVEKGNTIVKAPPSGPKIINLDTTKAKTPVASTSEVIGAGFLSTDLKNAREITGDSLGGRDIYSMGDKLFTGTKGVSVGDIFLIGRTTRKVSDPATGKYLGIIVDPTGLLKITENVGNKMVGVVEDSFTAIKPDDLLIPYAMPELTYEPVPANPGLSGRIGYVAALKDEKKIASEGDIIYLDMGSDIGVKPGDRFVIRRSGDKGSILEGKGYASPSNYVVPDTVVGEVVVVSVQSKSSSAKVAVFKEVFQAGYRAVYKD